MKKNNFKRVLCAILCLCMVTGTLFMLASCDQGADPANTEPTVSVVRVAKDIAEGTKITSDMLKTETVKVSNVPLNAIKDVAKIEGKYATQKLYEGEYVFAGKLTAKLLVSEDADYSANFVVTEHMEITADVTDALQKLINENPGRTLELPDGVYTISKPLTVPADCAKAVSLRLSDYAVIKAADSWSSNEAMICLANGSRNEESAPLSFYLSGGTIDANGKAKAISVGDARDILISNVNIENALVGIEVKAGAADMENITITGNGTDASVGMIISGNDSTAANVYISNVLTGVKVTGANNAFKSVCAVYAGTAVTSCGFVDTGKGSRYDLCESLQFAVGFKMAETTVSTYYACHAQWTDSALKTNIAFQSEGKFNSLIRNSVVDFDFADCNGAFLKAGAAEGNGQILYPMIGGSANMADTSYIDYLEGTSVIVK